MKFIPSAFLPAAGAALCLGGCLVQPEPRVVYVQQAPPPQQVDAQPTPENEVAVQSAPPPPQDEVIVGVAPAPDYLWIDGAWEWNGGGWWWRGGYWGHSPYAGARWYGGYYRYYGGRHYWVRGGWRGGVSHGAAHGGGHGGGHR